jgi:succinate dehydrogenase/fumarate reductase cytochrome b subunit
MNPTLLKALVGLLPTSMLFCGSAVLFLRAKTPYSLMQLLGAAGIALVILAHICEGLHLFPWMNWGLEHSAGHYVDLSGAVLAFALFPLGYLLHAKYASR